MRARIPDPQAESTFTCSKLHVDEAERSPGRDLAELYARLIALRHTDPVLVRQDRQALQARALSADVLAVRQWHGAAERLLVANFGDTEAAVTAFGGGWRPVLDTGPVAKTEADGLTVGPRSASILARGPE
jgi:maltooligosyltrehalose trehalohydrolase